MLISKKKKKIFSFLKIIEMVCDLLLKWSVEVKRLGNTILAKTRSNILTKIYLYLNNTSGLMHLDL